MSTPISKETFERDYQAPWLNKKNKNLYEVFQLRDGDGDPTGDFVKSYVLTEEDGLENLFQDISANLAFHMGCLSKLNGAKSYFIPFVEVIGASGNNYYPMRLDPNGGGIEIQINPPISRKRAIKFTNDMRIHFQAGNLSTIWESFHNRDQSECSPFASDACRLKRYTLIQDSKDDDFAKIKYFVTDSSGNLKSNALIKFHLGHTTQLDFPGNKVFNFRSVIEADDGQNNQKFFEFSSPCPHNCY